MFTAANEIQKIMMFGGAVFKPERSVELQKHDTMFQVFYIQKGKAVFFANNQKKN